MKVTYNWLKDFVDIDISAAELAQKLTSAGFFDVFFTTFFPLVAFELRLRTFLPKIRLPLVL